MQHPKIICIAGTFASGKDTLAKYLIDKFGFVHVSTGDMVRVEAQKQRGSVERPVLFEVANKMRHTKGAGYFAEQALKVGLEKGAPGVLINGIRSLGEAKAVRDAGGQVMFVDAPAEIRYERMLSRMRDNEVKLTLDEFKANESREWYNGPTDVDFNLRDIKKTADIVIENNLNLEDFLQEAVSKLKL